MAGRVYFNPLRTWSAADQLARRAVTRLADFPRTFRIFAALTILAVIVAASTLHELHCVNALTQKLAQTDARSLYLASAANDHLARVHRLLFELLLVKPGRKTGDLEAQIDNELATVNNFLEQLRPLLTTDAETTAYAEIADAIELYVADTARVRVAARRHDEATGQTLLLKTAPTYRRVGATLTALVNLQEQSVAEDAHHAGAWLTVVVCTTIVVAGLGIVIALALSCLISGSRLRCRSRARRA